MATQINWKARERRIRAKYHKKVWATGVTAAIVGLLVGFLLHLIFFGGSADTASTQPVVQPTPEIQVVYITPEPTEVPEITAEPTPQIIYVTPEPTEVPAVENTGVLSAAEPAVEADPTQAPIEAENTEVTIPTTIVTATEVPTEAPTAEPTAAPTAEPTAVPTEVPTAEPTAVPTEAPAVATVAQTDAAAVSAEGDTLLITDPAAAATEAPVVEPTEAPVDDHQPIIVSYGDSVTFNTQIKKDGTARRDVADTDYETISLTMKVDAYKRPSYFEEYYYDTFSLKGDEAAVEFDITLNSYMGTTQIIPQNFILITLRGESDDVTAQGYQLMDKEINGKTGVAITTDKTTTLYKRYPYSAQQGHMKYMVVTTYNDGIEQEYWFDIIDPNPVTYDELSKGVKDHSDEVKRLQGKLQRMGLLSAEEKIDGKFGSNTEAAVIEAQKLLGMEETGIADDEFLHKLYDDK